MPPCKLCRRRIDLSKTGIRAKRCVKCGAAVCRDHYREADGLCYGCAGLPVRANPMAFVRAPKA